MSQFDILDGALSGIGSSIFGGTSAPDDVADSGGLFSDFFGDVKETVLGGVSAGIKNAVNDALGTDNATNTPTTQSTQSPKENLPSFLDGRVDVFGVEMSKGVLAVTGAALFIVAIIAVVK